MMRAVRAPSLLRRITPDGWMMIAIVGVVLLANLPYLVGVFDPNPLGPRGSLVTASTPGPVGGQPTIDPNNGFVSQALGHRAALDLIHLQLPWWNPYEGTGAPLAGEMQSAALFPPTLLLLASNGQLFEHLLLEILAGIATYLVLRRIACNRWASFAGGAAFALNGSFAWFAHAPVNPIAFLPLLLLGIERAYSATLEGRRHGWRLIAIAGALSFYAGFPEVAYIDTLLGICWFGWRLGCLERSRWRTFVTKTGAGAAVGILLAAPLIVAGLDYLGHADLSIHANTSLGSAHFPPESLPQLFMPYIYGPIFGFTGSTLQLTGLWGAVGGYVSTSLLLLGALGLVSRGRRGLRVVLSIWIVLVFARMYGQVPLLGHILGWLPGMAHIAFFRYATPALELPLVILAALGIDDVLTVPEHRRRAVWAGLAMLVIVAIGAIGARTLADDLCSHYASRPYYAVAIAWGALVVVAIAAVCLIKRVPRRGALLAAVVALDALVLFAAPELSAPRTVTVDGAPAAFLRTHLGNSRFFTLGPMQPNYGAYYGVASLNINDIPIPSSLSTYIHDRLDPYVNTTVFVGNYGGGRSLFAPSPQKELIQNIAGYRDAGVSYVLAPAGQRLPSSLFTLVARTPTAWIYHVAGAAPYFSAAGCATRAAGRDAVTVSCPRPSTLIRRETDLPGWSATVGGSGAPVRTIDGLFEAVRVPAGTHAVSFSYAPPLIVWGAVAFAGGLLALGISLLPAGARPRALTRRAALP
jgi:hypothetical protein